MLVSQSCEVRRPNPSRPDPRPDPTKAVVLHPHPQKPRCLSCAARRSIYGRRLIVLEYFISCTPDFDREDSPTVRRRSSTRQESQSWRLCDPGASTMYDTRQFMACCDKIHVNWGVQDTRSSANRNDTGSRCSEQERVQFEKIPAD